MASKYQHGYDDERFDTIANRNFHCLICFNVLRDPVMCRRNQHYFCRGCITEHLRRNSHRCPTCADGLSVETLCDVPRIVKNYLDELSIRCDYYHRGCRELVQLQNLKYHVAECGFSPVVCGNEGCGETISKRDRIYHESELCEFRKVKCHNCGEISTKMTAMDTKMEMMNMKVGNMDMRMGNINTKTTSTGKNLADVNKKMANTDTQIANVKTNLAEVKTKMINMERRVANIDWRMANTDTKMANVETILTDVNREMANVKTNLADVKTKMENVEMRMADLQAKADARFEAMNNEVREMKMSLTEVKDGFDHLKEAVLNKVESKERNQEGITREVNDTTSGSTEKQHIFVAGGWRRNSVEIFNYRQRLWSLLKPMPGRQRWKASSFVYNNQVTVAGGFCSGSVDNMIQMNTKFIPDLKINWIDFAAKLPVKMRGHSSVVYKDSLFVTGGYNAHEGLFSDCINEVQLKPPYTVRLLSKMPEPRVDHSTILCEDSILVFGGTTTGYNEHNLSSVVSYDLKKNKCQQLPQLPYPVSKMVTVKLSENAVIIGGVDKNGNVLNNVIIYNIKTGNSHMLPPMLHKRKGCIGVVIQNTIVVLGGCDERESDLKSVEEFSFDRYTWEELPHMKEDRVYATAVVI